MQAVSQVVADINPPLGTIAPCWPDGQVHEISEDKRAVCFCAFHTCLVDFANRVTETLPADVDLILA